MFAFVVGLLFARKNIIERAIIMIIFKILYICYMDFHFIFWEFKYLLEEE